MIQNPLLQVNNLSVSFKKASSSIPIIHGINFHLHKGESLALVGGSGSGKSVTAQAIMRLLDPSAKISGDILFEEKNLLAKKENEMQKIRGKKMGMVFQDPMTSLNPTMKIGTQLTEAIRFHEKISYSESRQKSLQLLKELEISDPEMRFNAYPFQLSGGMRQRVMIGIALSCNPQLLIADEPTTALDVTVQAQILSLIRVFQQKNQMSLLLITHDLGIVAGMCDRIIVMCGGQIVETGTTEQIFENPQHPHTQTLLHFKRNANWTPPS